MVWDDHGDWHATHFDTAEAARDAWDALSLTHASVLFVQSEAAPGVATRGAGDDDPAWTWTPTRQYGLPHATKRIRDRFFKSRALRRSDSAPGPRSAPRLLRPRRRTLGGDPPGPEATVL